MSTLTIRCLRSWSALRGNFCPGEEYQVPEFIAVILIRGGYAEIVSAVAVEVARVQQDLWS